MTTSTCPLCSSPQVEDYFEDKRRRFNQCQQCQLVFVEKDFLPSLDREKKEYRLHENNHGDPGYIRFLNKLALPLLANLEGNCDGLDFGCGPTPVLASMLEDGGHKMKVYDPIFHDDTSVLNGKYDFVTCTEAIEHFHTPHKEWHQLLSLLSSGGILAIMTKRVLNKERFANWHYKNDYTHVSFFSEATFKWLATQYHLDLELVGDDVVFFRIKSPVQ